MKEMYFVTDIPSDKFCALLLTHLSYSGALALLIWHSKPSVAQSSDHITFNISQHLDLVQRWELSTKIEHDLSETGFVSILRWKRADAPVQLALDGAVLNHCTNLRNAVFSICVFKSCMMDEAQKLSGWKVKAFVYLPFTI